VSPFRTRLIGVIFILFFGESGPAFASSDVADAVMRRDTAAVKTLLRNNGDVTASRRDNRASLGGSLG
jgi:hypothetical protein